jgi:hypothetical protein
MLRQRSKGREFTILKVLLGLPLPCPSGESAESGLRPALPTSDGKYATAVVKWTVRDGSRKQTIRTITRSRKICMKSISACSKGRQKLRLEKEMRYTLDKRASRFKGNQVSPLETSSSNGKRSYVEDRLVSSKLCQFCSDFSVKLSKSLRIRLN